MHRMSLPPLLDISVAPELLKLCQDACDEKKILACDASNVERITTPAFQILISLFNMRKAAGLNTRVVDASTQFSEAAAALGLSQWFMEEDTHG